MLITARLIRAYQTMDDGRWTIRSHLSSIVYRLSSVIPANRRLISEFDIGPDGSVAFIGQAPDNPCDLYLRRPDGGEAQLTHINQPLLDARVIAPIEELIYRAPDGREVQGWLLRPPGFDAGGSYPLAVHIHGGPHVMWGPGFRSMWHEWQATAARGYVVFFCNPRGSEGYGEQWRDAIHASWGEADARALGGGSARRDPRSRGARSVPPTVPRLRLDCHRPVDRVPRIAREDLTDDRR